ncbi:hypothetical protein [Pseudoalteromonas sp. G4]|uniref:hypothetical protein n=1 Tax=Pseudoalteromonas sp. G4 TaxID=2992761 RepID=UPI00237D39C7|nr:hypothetical protein [Pseudoalteromonas sp. G4]MDE3272701.1 hypothetical protein [Pseudoalteromonas sp. G4]
MKIKWNVASIALTLLCVLYINASALSENDNFAALKRESYRSKTELTVYDVAESNIKRHKLFLDYYQNRSVTRMLFVNLEKFALLFNFSIFTLSDIPISHKIILRNSGYAIIRLDKFGNNPEILKLIDSHGNLIPQAKSDLAVNSPYMYDDTPSSERNLVSMKRLLKHWEVDLVSADIDSRHFMLRCAALECDLLPHNS